MMNSMNHGTFIGRLVKDPVYFEGKDKSCMVMLDVAARRNFASGKERTYESDFITFKGYIGKGVAHHGVFGLLATGDMVGINYSLRSSIVEKDGETKYYQGPFIESIDILEGKNKRNTRRAARESK